LWVALALFGRRQAKGNNEIILAVNGREDNKAGLEAN
jgi:hypothetical protein